MKLYLVRHATAVAADMAGVGDEARALTEEGARRMKKAAQGMKSLDLAPDVILTSPFLRAKETATIVRSVLSPLIPVQEVTALQPGGDRDEVYRAIQAHEGAEAVMLIGHQPSLGEIAGEVALGSAHFALDLKKGGTCEIEIERMVPIPRGTLRWLLTPSILRSMH